MQPVNTPQEPVIIEYTSRDKRVTKLFTDQYKAKQFYIGKFKSGKEPKVQKVSS